MNCHQILSGACNAGDRCFAIGSVEGIPFTAYAAGCNVVILASTFERVQIIPGANHGYVKISALDCSTDTGKIAAAYENKICIFEPTPVIESSKHNTHFLDYRWVQTGSFTSHSSVVTLSWNLEGTRLLTGGTNIQLWKSKSPTHQPEEEHTGVKFEIGESKEPNKPNNAQAEDVSTWENIWSCQTAIPIYHMAFSPDGTLFATCGRNDRLVKIWYENKQVLFPAKGTATASGSSGVRHGGDDLTGSGSVSGGELNFTYVYIAHPRAVSNIVWRKTSKYMPKGSVANMLVTSCLDNICRIWIETVLPDDGLVNMTQFDPLASQNPKFRTHRHKHRFMQRLKHMKTCFHIRRHMKAGATAGGVAGGGVGGAPGAGIGGVGATGGGGGGMNSSPASYSNYLGPIPSLPSSCSVHDFHSYGFQGSGVTPGMHFHLAASINAETDIPLVPSMQTSDPASQNVFILHWLNNKEMHFTLQAEAILQELTKKVIDEENGHDLPDDAHGSHGSHSHSQTQAHRKYLRSSKSVSVDDSGEEYSRYSQHTAGGGAGTGVGAGLHLNSMSNTTSQNSLNNEPAHPITQLVDSLDNKIECLLRDWHQSPDLLFAIHPVDGSYLIWVIEWLDDYYPGSFRQAQVSFSTRIPSAFPLGDAMSMSTTVSLFNTGTHPLAFRDIANNVRSKDEFHKGQADDSSLKSDQHSGQTFERHDEEQEDVEDQDGDEDREGDADQDEAGGGGGAGDRSAAASGAGAEHSSSSQDSGAGGASNLPLNVSPSVSMVTKHSNGTLNLWQLTFAFKTKFTQVLSIGHVSRASGHRFRVNDITCHPVLPLLVSTSHHNLPDSEAKSPMSPFEQPLSSNGLGGGGGSGGGGGGGGSGGGGSTGDKDVFTPTGFCSELILWRVDSVGPLCHSGGVSELARINSPEISAFSNVAWIPTLLPSTTLGSYSNSPSACFVASDGENLRVYQAVIDARTLLAEISCSENLNTLHKSHSLSSMISNASSTMRAQRSALHDKLKVVSQQSTARPGCILQLDAISDAKHDWQNTQFLHVFQAQLITGGQRTPLSDPHDLEEPRLNALLESDMDAIVDLQRNADFEEPFYIVNIEKTLRGSTIHMWRIVISSKQQNSFLSETAMYVPDSNLTQEPDEENGGGGGGGPNPGGNPNPRRMSQGAETLTGAEHFGDHVEAPHISITTKKVCTQELPLPEGVDVIHASPAAGHLSSSSIYPACFAPYIIVTACSDSISRFWKCEPILDSDLDGDGDEVDAYHWSEWKMFSRIQQSAIEIPGQPLNISAAYSGRIACAYKYGKSFTRPNKGPDPDSRYVNLCVAIYECESSGGSEWVLEDTIHLKNVHLPRINIGHGIDLSYLHDSRLLAKKQRLNQVLHTFAHDPESRSPRSGETTPELAVNRQPSAAASGLLTVPSFSTLQSLRKSIAENGNTCPLTQKHLVQLDWVSKEDGSHILTVAVGSKILLYTPVSSDIAQANIKAMKESRSVNRPILRKASSLAQPNFVDEIRWMKLRQIDLQTADGLPPLPMQISWVRDGILVVAMDSEMHVYSQWKPHYSSHFAAAAAAAAGEDVPDTRNLRDEDLRSLANESTQLRLKNVASMPLISKVSTANLQLLSHDKKRRLGNTSMANMNGGGGAGGGAGGGGAGGPYYVGAGQDDGGNDDYMTDFGLFQASRIACPVLPQYHPKQLMELLNCGKIRWVKAILAHLVRCMSGTNSSTAGQDEDGYARQRSWSRSRTLSISYTAETNIQAEHRGSTTQIPEELMLDYAEINSIPPLPLWVLLNADRETPGQGTAGAEGDKDYDELFDMHNSEDNLDELLCDGEEKKRQERRLSLPEKQSISHFGPRQGQLLSRLLTHTHLPGLSSLDQMHLLALADTVATCNTDFSDKFAVDQGKSAGGAGAGAGGAGSGGGKDGSTSTDSLDDCGLRFLLAMKHFTYLLRCLPLQQRAQFQRQGVGTSNIVWAYHSESEEELLNLIPSYTKGDLRWATLRDLGVGYWLKNINTLRRCVEKLAKCAYQLKQDPLDAAIYYLAMKKKSLVWGLFRSRRDEKMTAFFGNNFAEDRWRKAALKNAFVLLGKQRFEHAVAFFLLANSLNDAIEVCMNKLEDFQLALIIARLYEGDAEGCYYHKLLHEHILGTEAETGRCDLTRAHPDPFLRSMTYWTIKKHQESLNTLLLNGVGSLHSSYREEDLLRPEPQATNPNVFNFYIYLRTHPLLIRQNIALSAQEKRIAHVVLSGFNYAGDVAGPSACDKQLQLEDTITPIERQLYFTTAHGHFKSGCPALALEVLNKLPMKISDDSGGSVAGSQAPDCGQQNKEDLINTGIMDQWDSSAGASAGASTADAFDWGAPVASSEPEAKFEIKWDDDDEDEAEEGDDAEPDDPELATPQPQAAVLARTKSSAGGNDTKMDIMAQQLKFVACLKILMEELSTLATGFEVDGGQLRYQLYMWLEREVEALKQLCNYCSQAEQSGNESGDPDADNRDKEMNASICPSTERPTLHEILMQDKQDFEAKVMRAAKRKRWLKANETLLRTLLSYCSLHGASGGGLASVRMELVLLLQELQQEKTQQQLLSPLPFPTTLPLLSACVAGNKTVIADPIKYLQSQTVDMLQSIIKVLPFPGIEPSALSEIFVLRDLAVALSSCIYQSLCDSESFVVNNSAFNGYPSPGIENIAKINSSFECSYLVGSRNAYGRRRKYSTDEPAGVCTTPSKWPGVTNLRALLAREKDEDVPKLNVLLLESFVSTYMALFIYSLSTCDSRLLYRLSGQSFTNETWSTLFGGGMKKLLIKPAAAQPSGNQQPAGAGSVVAGHGNTGSTSEEPADENSVWNTVTSITKQRMKLNMKILGSFSQNSTSSNMKEDKPTYREQFMPPETSMLSYFLSKPPATECDDYDTDDSHESENEEEEEDDDDVNVSRSQLKAKDNTEHTNPTSYSWSILRLALIKISTHKIQELVKVAGIELQDLPVISPLSHEVLRTLNRWQDFALSDLIGRGPPSRSYIPGCYAESGINGLGIHKYRSLLNKDNTPFVSGSAAGPIRRLWNYLVRQEPAQEVFIKSIFGKNMEPSTRSSHHTQHDNETDEGQSHSTNENTDQIRIIHKDHESILSFCLKNNTSSMIAFANPREIQEFDISLLLESPNWYEDECDYDMMNLSKDADTNSSSFLIIQKEDQNQFGGSSNAYTESSASTQSASQSGRGTSMVLRHKVDNVKRMSAHPLMPLYLTGGQDGSVQIWEWGHQQPVCSPRTSGTYAKVTRCRFSEQGNKFGIGDGDGKLSLWQAGIASQNNRSFISYQCHNKSLSDFVFLGSCSLLASAGQSSENKNINIWDTLLPNKKSCVSAFTCHDQGSSCLVFAPQHQVLISCGKRGDICVFDVRQRTLRHRYQAHDSTIKCIALDPHEEFFVTGSIEGDIKIWDMNQFVLINTFPHEHAKNGFFKHTGQGVSQVYVDPFGRLFSCGSDGCMKVRLLVEKDNIVHSVY